MCEPLECEELNGSDNISLINRLKKQAAADRLLSISYQLFSQHTKYWTHSGEDDKTIQIFKDFVKTSKKCISSVEYEQICCDKMH